MYGMSLLHVLNRTNFQETGRSMRPEIYRLSHRVHCCKLYITRRQHLKNEFPEIYRPYMNGVGR